MKQSEVVEVDQIQIRLESGRDDSPIPQPVEPRGILRHPVNDLLQSDPGASRSIPDPVGEHEGGNARVADETAVCPAISEPEDHTLVLHHLPQGFTIAAGVVEKREEQKITPVVP